MLDLNLGMRKDNNTNITGTLVSGIKWIQSAGYFLEEERNTVGSHPSMWAEVGWRLTTEWLLKGKLWNKIKHRGGEFAEVCQLWKHFFFWLWKAPQPLCSSTYQHSAVMTGRDQPNTGYVKRKTSLHFTHTHRHACMHTQSIQSFICISSPLEWFRNNLKFKINIFLSNRITVFSLSELPSQTNNCFFEMLISCSFYSIENSFCYVNYI